MLQLLIGTLDLGCVPRRLLDLGTADAGVNLVLSTICDRRLAHGERLRTGPSTRDSVYSVKNPSRSEDSYDQSCSRAIS